MPVYLEHAGRRNIQCQGCHGKRPAVTRCLDCFGCLSWCHECIIQRHTTLLCHRLEKWNGQCFSRTTLMAKGFLLHLGHGGLPCLNPWEGHSAMDAAQNTHQKPLFSQTVTLVAINGFFEHKVSWCGCFVEGQVTPSAMQLFNERLFPATQSRPETTFAFNLLDYFWVDMMECNTANQSFIRKLGRITNPDFPADSPV